jgi:hypothetical protein
MSLDDTVRTLQLRTVLTYKSYFASILLCKRELCP